MKTKPFPYQIEAVEGIECFDGRCLVAYPVGSGKSLITLLYTNRHPEIKPIIIICPSYLKWNWANEISTHIGKSCEILEGLTPKKQSILSRHSIWIVNYDILGPRRNGKGKIHSGWLDFLIELEPQLVVIDESQYCKSMKATRTKAVKTLCKEVPHIIALSGTPLVNRPSELFPILNILRPDKYPKFYPYATDFCQIRRTPWGIDYRGAKNLDILHRELKRYVMIRKRKEEILKDLPPQMRFVTPLVLSHIKEYEEAVKDFIGWLSKISTVKADLAAKAEQIAKLNYLLRLTWKLKKESIYNWIDDYLEETDDKLLVFGINRDVVEDTHKRYQKISVMVHGGITSRKRQDCFDAFNSNPEIRMLVGNVQAAGTGWSARDCSTVAFIQLPWVPGEVTQAEGRCHGLKRGKEGVPTLSYYLIGRGTIEEDLCRILQKKQKIVDATLEGNTIRGSLDVYDLLCKELRKEK